MRANLGDINQDPPARTTKRPRNVLKTHRQSLLAVSSFSSNLFSATHDNPKTPSLSFSFFSRYNTIIDPITAIFIENPKKFGKPSHTPLVDRKTKEKSLLDHCKNRPPGDPLFLQQHHCPTTLFLSFKYRKSSPFSPLFFHFF